MPLSNDGTLPGADDRAFASSWHPRLCIAGLAAAVTLFLSWIAPPLRAWWNALDIATFRALNPSLAEPGLWQTFWAIANWRPFDTVVAFIVFGLAISWLRAEQGRSTRLRLAHFIGFCVLLILAKACEHLLLDITGYRRASPTNVFPDAIRLSELVTWINVKDRGSATFPGDHAFVIFATVGFFWICAGRYLGIIAAVVLIPFTLPRLVGGAHWITDILVGALSMAIVLLTLSYATPLAKRLTYAIDKHAGPLLQLAIGLGRRLRILR